ncbi:MAG: hypothetical protein AB7F96_04380 [Beijerinckiaceae bacterium]
MMALHDEADTVGGIMPRRERAFLFCRYILTIGDEVVAPEHHLTLFQELQGQNVVHGRSTGAGDVANTLLMRPREHMVEGAQIITMSVGYQTGGSLQAKYDARHDEISHTIVGQDGVRYSDFVIVPSLGVMAIDDRASDVMLGGRPAINRLKSVIRSKDDGDISVVAQASPDEVRKALTDWSLTSFNFTVRPNNPRPVSRLAEDLSEQLKKDGIGQLRAIARPAGREMRMSPEGLMVRAADLSDAGYGQYSLTGITPSGLEAQIKKPTFSQDRERNERAQDKPRELRVFVDTDGLQEDQILLSAGRALIEFYS